MSKKNIYIFFYGSVVNKHSRQYTLQKHKLGIPICFKDINYKLSYNFSSNSQTTSSSSFSVLGLTKSKSKHSIPGILVKINNEELKYIKKREKTYNLIDISENTFSIFNKKDHINKNIPIFTFVKDHTDKKHIHTNYYLDLTISGFLEYNESFAKLFFKHCHSLPPHLNTLSKWKKELKKRIIEYTSVIHYAKNDKLIQTLKDIL